MDLPPVAFTIAVRWCHPARGGLGRPHTGCMRREHDQVSSGGVYFDFACVSECLIFVCVCVCLNGGLQVLVALSGSTAMLGASLWLIGRLQASPPRRLSAAIIPMENPYCSCRLTVVIPVENPYCSCRLITRVRPQLASIIQYLPLPVIGGYLAYIGMYCFEAGAADDAHDAVSASAYSCSRGSPSGLQL